MRKSLLVLLVILSTILTLLVVEGIFRILSINDQIRFMLVDQPSGVAGLYEYDQDLGWKNRPDYHAKFLWPHRQTDEIINSHGWRDHDHAYAKPNGVFRIAVIGCSRTYGYGVNMEETYSKVLEQLLNKDSSVKYEVMNFGVNGYGLDQMALNYSLNVRKYSPDLVVLQFFMHSVYKGVPDKNMDHSKTGLCVQ